MALTLHLLLFLSFYAGLSSCGSSSNSGAGPADQVCGTTGFYCTGEPDPSNKCKPRSSRCVGSDVCPNEDGCGETVNEGQYYVNLGHAELGLFGSRKRQYKLEHQFITYRGFTYEFGMSYGVQILDINDPDYKYINGRSLNSNGIETVGRSYCTQADADQFASIYDDRYSLNSNNCQHFTIALQEHLLRTSCNQPPSTRGKRQGADLVNEINAILTNCSIVCCDDDNSSAVPTVTTNIWMSLLSVLVFIVIGTFS